MSYDALIDPGVGETCLAVAKRREAAFGNSSTLLLNPPLECPEGEDPKRYANFLMMMHQAHLTALYDRFTVVAKTFAIKGKPGKDPDRPASS